VLSVHWARGGGAATLALLDAAQGLLLARPTPVAAAAAAAAAAPRTAPRPRRARADDSVPARTGKRGGAQRDEEEEEEEEEEAPAPRRQDAKEEEAEAADGDALARRSLAAVGAALACFQQGRLPAALAALRGLEPPPAREARLLAFSAALADALPAAAEGAPALSRFVAAKAARHRVFRAAFLVGVAPTPDGRALWDTLSAAAAREGVFPPPPPRLPTASPHPRRAVIAHSELTAAAAALRAHAVDAAPRANEADAARRRVFEGAARALWASAAGAEAAAWEAQGLGPQDVFFSLATRLPRALALIAEGARGGDAAAAAAAADALLVALEAAAAVREDAEPRRADAQREWSPLRARVFRRSPPPPLPPSPLGRAPRDAGRSALGAGRRGRGGARPRHARRGAQRA
jgi:hypothetical protein